MILTPQTLVSNTGLLVDTLPIVEPRRHTAALRTARLAAIIILGTCFTVLCPILWIRPAS